LGRGLGWVTPRGPCQPLHFCDSHGLAHPGAEEAEGLTGGYPDCLARSRELWQASAGQFKTLNPSAVSSAESGSLWQGLQLPRQPWHKPADPGSSRGRLWGWRGRDAATHLSG